MRTTLLKATMQNPTFESGKSDPLKTENLMYSHLFSTRPNNTYFQHFRAEKACFSSKNIRNSQKLKNER